MSPPAPCWPCERKRHTNVNELRKLLKDLLGVMPVGVAYPDEKHADQCHETTEVRTDRVTDPFHKFAGLTKETVMFKDFKKLVTKTLAHSDAIVKRGAKDVQAGKRTLSGNAFAQKGRGVKNKKVR